MEKMKFVAGALLALSLILAQPTGGVQSVDAASGCSAWASTTRPPPIIRVLTRGGHIVRVPIRKYVVTVMGHEWPGYLPYALQQAGAVAVKQYAWWKARHPRRSTVGCFDVRSGTTDQIYNPKTARITLSHYLAVASSWSTYIHKSDGTLLMTGYRRGKPGRRCGADANGWKLYALSAKQCAKRGYSYRAILRLYYQGKVFA